MCIHCRPPSLSPENRDRLSVSSSSLCPEEGSRHPLGSLDIRVRNLSAGSYSAGWEELGQGNLGDRGETCPIGVIAGL